MDWTLTQMVLTIVFGITTVVMSIVAIRLAKRKKSVWARKTTKIIGIGTDAPPQLKLTFNNELITDVYRTTFIFFNKGNEPIRKDDITENITVQFQMANILQPPVVKAISREAIRFSAKQIVKNDENSIEMDFLYLDHNDGAVIEVLHTEANTIACLGNIIGTKVISYIDKFESVRPKWWFLSVKLIFPAVLVGIGMYAAVNLIQDLIAGNPPMGIYLWMSVFMVTIPPLIIWAEILPLFGYMVFPRWSAAAQ